MSASYIYKPNTYKGPVLLVPSDGPRGKVTITAPDGRTFEGRYLNTNEGRHQYVFEKDLYGYENLKVSYNGQTGTIGSGVQAYEGSSISSWDPRQKGSGAGGSGGPGTTGVPGQFAPGMAGQYGAIPAYIGNLFPNPVLANYNPITAAPYQFTDPMKYAEKFGEFNRKEIYKNFDVSKDLALKEIDTELSTLQHFVPAASALKRQETALDNQFNQAQRTQQVDTALPEARGDLAGQRSRALALASGRFPGEIEDRGFELGVRSAAADSAAAGGFGASSSVARKSSDLLSSTQRLGLSKYGDQLLTQNINEKAALYLAPTEYSNAGTQVQVMPSLSPSQLINSNLNAINGLTTITPAQGLQSETQQNQFTTGLEQQTRTFNASNQLQTEFFNAGTQNQFALDKFQYQATYANSVAGGAQANINTQVGLDQQNMFLELMKKYAEQAQNAASVQSGAGLLGILGAITGSAVKGKGGGDSKTSDSAVRDAGGAADAVRGAADAAGDAVDHITHGFR